MTIKNKCLYCGRKDGKFSSVEHVVPESMGNKELILPKGIVCDRCNNGILAQLDKYILNYGPIKFMLVYFRVPNKAGKYTEAKFGNMKMYVTKTGMHVDVDGLSAKHYAEEPIQPDKSVKFKLRMKDKKDTPATRKKLARALYKIALGAVCRYDSTLAYSDRFDEARDIILGKKDFSGYFIQFSNKPVGTGSVHHQFLESKDGGKNIMIFIINLFGLEFMFDMEKRNLITEHYKPPKPRPDIQIVQW